MSQEPGSLDKLAHMLFWGGLSSFARPEECWQCGNCRDLRQACQTSEEQPLDKSTALRVLAATAARTLANWGDFHQALTKTHTARV